MSSLGRFQILIASRSAPALKVLAACAGQVAGVQCTTRLISNGHADPLHGVDPLPDAVLLRFDVDQLAELQALAGVDPNERPPLIVIGPSGSGDAFRLAVQAGARDFLPEPVSAQDVVAAIERLKSARRARPGRPAGDTIVFAGAAGGVGTSLLACNVAVGLAGQPDSSGTTLVDLDVGYAPATGMLDLQPERGLIEALQEAESLDEHAASGYGARHRSGLQVLGAAGRRLVMPSEMDPARLATLLAKLASFNRRVVVDLPHRIDDKAASCLGLATHVVIVLQQSVAQVRNAVRLIEFLGREIGLPNDRLRIVVNRYSKRSTVTLDDIEQALKLNSISTIPSHYASALSSIDGGFALLEADRGAPLSRAVLELCDELSGVPRAQKGGFLSRALPIFAKG